MADILKITAAKYQIPLERIEAEVQKNSKLASQNAEHQLQENMLNNDFMCFGIAVEIRPGDASRAKMDVISEGRPNYFVEMKERGKTIKPPYVAPIEVAPGISIPSEESTKNVNGLQSKLSESTFAAFQQDEIFGSMFSDLFLMRQIDIPTSLSPVIRRYLHLEGDGVYYLVKDAYEWAVAEKNARQMKLKSVPMGYDESVHKIAASVLLFSYVNYEDRFDFNSDRFKNYFTNEFKRLYPTIKEPTIRIIELTDTSEAIMDEDDGLAWLNNLDPFLIQSNKINWSLDFFPKIRSTRGHYLFEIGIGAEMNGNEHNPFYFIEVPDSFYSEKK